MNLDLKNNNYLLSLVAGIVGTLIYLVIDKVTSNKENKKVDYVNYIKVFIIIIITVLCILMYVRSDTKVSTESVSVKTGESIPMAEIRGSGGGLQEVNMNESIHTGNPTF
jgi:hypothetical protein